MKHPALFRAAALTVCLILIFSLCLTETQATKIDRYGYSQLQNDAQKTAYDALVKGIGALETQIEIGIATAEFDDVIYAATMVSKDYPEYFWYHGQYELQSDGTRILFIPAAYTVNGEAVTAGCAALASAQSQIDKAANAVLQSLPADPSDYEIAHAIHDYIVDKVNYAQAGDHQTAYGALVCQEAVCAGYARAYQLLLNRAGISCWYVEGHSYSPEGELVPHAWNLVWLDGLCYYSDVTWDDQNGELFHEYLNMSLEQISKTHFTSDPLPASCGHDTYTFFRMNNGDGVCDIRDHKSAEEVAGCFVLKQLEGNIAEYYCTIHYHGEDFGQWVSDNLLLVAEELGYCGSLSYNLIELGHEHHVTLIGEVQSAETTPPTSNPTEPSSVPTEPPTTPTTAPTEPSTEATVPSTAPTNEPSEPSTEPTTVPTSPPTEPPTEPTEPSTLPTEPTEPSTAPTTPPTEPSTEPSQSVTVPSSAPTQPSETVTEPSASVSPTQESTVPQETATPSTENTNTPTGTTAPPQLPGTTQTTPETAENSTASATTATQTDSEKPADDGARPIIIAGVCIVGVLITLAVILFVKKKKNG